MFLGIEAKRGYAVTTSFRHYACCGIKNNEAMRPLAN